MQRILIVLCSVGLLLAVLAPSAMASSPQPVTIDSTMQVGGVGPNTGTFTRVSGSGLICGAGTITDTRYVWGESRGRGGNPNGVPLVVDKTFDCGDGLVFLRLQIRGVFVSETFTWVVLGGTGAYAGLRGQGSGYTDYEPIASPGTVVNHYLGVLIG